MRNRAVTTSDADKRLHLARMARLTRFSGVQVTDLRQRSGMTPERWSTRENGFVPRRVDGFVDAARDALRAYLRFAEARRLEWAPHLGAEKRLFLTRP